MEQRAFVKIIQSFRRRMNIASVLHKSVAALSIGAIAGILFQAAALVVPFYYASLYSGLALAVSFLTALALAYVKRTSLEQAALAMDSFGFDERIVTAYECLGQEGMLVGLQREDAMNQLAKHRDRIRIALLPPWKKTVLLLGFLAVMAGLALLPSAVKERARELHEVRKEAREQMKELEELAGSLEELVQEEISQEQKSALQEMLGSLEASQTEFEQADSAKLFAAASSKLEYKYAMMGSELEEFAQRLRDGAAASAMTAESMQVMAERMQELGGMQSAKGNAMQTGSNQNGPNGSQNGQGSNASQSGPNGSQSGQGSNASQSGPNGSQSGQGSNTNQSGQNGSQSGQGSNASQTGQTGQNGSQNGQNANGSQNRDSTQGSGRGAGSNAVPHDYVSIPNDIADSGNLTGNAANHEDSEYFRAQNGLGWEGTHTTYESVIGSYEQKAYEGIAAGQYPSGMEEVIKQYFSSFNQ